MGLYSQLITKVAAITNWMNNVIANSKENHEFAEMSPINRDALFRVALISQSYKISMQQLFDELASDLVVGNVPIRFISISIDHDAAGTELSKMITAINSGPAITINQGFSYYFYNSRAVLTNGVGIGTPGGETYGLIRNHFALKKQLEPDGNGNMLIGSGEVQLITSDFYPSFTLDSRDLTPVEFDLGDIGTSNIFEAVNTTGPYSTPNSTTVVFKAVQNSNDMVWIYRGDQEEIGDGEGQTVLEDYLELIPGNTTEPPPYQETLPSQTTALTQQMFALKNHEGEARFMSSANTSITKFIPQGDISDFDLFGYFRALISTVGRVDFPTVEGSWYFNISGTSGTATLSIGDDSYTINFNTDANTTASSFVSSEAANILADNGFVLTNPSGSQLKIVGGTLGLVSLVSATGDLSGSRVDSTIEAVQIGEAEFEADSIYDMFIEWDGFRINYWNIKRKQ